MKPQRFWIGLSAVCVLLLATPLAAAPGRAQQPVSKEQLGGTILSLTPQIAYDQAVLRVSGPDGYSLSRRIPAGTPITADLAGAGASALPDGLYHYELVLTDAAGTRSQTSGAFYVEAGVTVSRKAKRAELGSTRGSLLRSAKEASPESSIRPPGTEDSTTNGYFIISAYGGFDDMYLAIENTYYPSMGMQNLAGSLRLAYDVGYTPGAVLLTALPNGNVGIGTTAPQKKLHVQTTTLFDGIQLGNDAGGANTTTWNFAVDGFAGLTIQDVENGNAGVMRLRKGAPAESLVITAAGDVGMGTASPSAKLHVTGSGRIDGDVALASSRTLKTGFGSVNPADTLARVADLPVASWRYKREEDSARHVGPFAEDFQRLFGLGDGETISVIDAQGVTFAAIQGLQQELVERDAEVAALRKRLTELEEALMDLVKAQQPDP